MGYLSQECGEERGRGGEREREGGREEGREREREEGREGGKKTYYMCMYNGWL